MNSGCKIIKSGFRGRISSGIKLQKFFSKLFFILYPMALPIYFFFLSLFLILFVQNFLNNFPKYISVPRLENVLPKNTRTEFSIEI